MNGINCMKLRYLYFILFILHTHLSIGQSEQFWTAFKITKAEKRGTKTHLTIGYGSEIGLQVNQKAEIYLAPSTQRASEKIIQYAGSAQVEEVSLGQAIVVTEISESFFKDDLIFIQVHYVSHEFTPLFYLSLYAINLTAPSGKPYYTYDEVMKGDGPELKSRIFNLMLSHIQTEGHNLKKSRNQVLVEAGKNKDKLVSEVLTAADSSRLHTYLIYLVQNFESNSGQTYALIQSFTEFETEGDRLSPPQLRNLFVKKDSAFWTSNYEQYARRIDSGLLSRWVGEAKEMRDSQEYSSAVNLLEACSFLARKNGDNYNAGYYSFEVASVYYDNIKDYASSIRWFRQAETDFINNKSLYGQGYALHYLASAYSIQKQTNDAIEAYQRAIAVRTELVKAESSEESYKNDLINSMNSLASLFKATGNYDQALKWFEQALEHTNRYELKSKHADVLWSLGVLYDEGWSNHRKANENYLAAIQDYLSESLKDTASAVTLKRNVANNYNKLKRPIEAKQQISEAVRLARAWGDKATLAYALDFQGFIARENRDFNLSFASYSEAEHIYKQMGDTIKLLAVKNDWADGYVRAKKFDLAEAKILERIKLIPANDLATHADAYWDYAFIFGKENANNARKAISYYQVAEKDYIILKDTTNLATIYNNIAFQYRDLRDSVNAYKMHEKALSLTRHISQRVSAADTYERLATTAKNFHHYTRCADAYLKAIDIQIELKNLVKAGSDYELLADVYEERSQYDKANQYLKESIRVYHEAGDISNEAESYWDLAYNLGQHKYQYDSAIEYYRVAYSMYMGIADSVNASVMLSNIGQNYWSKLDYENAIKSHQAAIELAEKCKNNQQVAKSWSNLAKLYTESNNPVSGSFALTQAVRAAEGVSDSTLLSATYQDLATSYSSSKEYENAMLYFNKAISIRKAQKDTLNWSNSLNSLGGVYQNKTQYKEAAYYYGESLKLQRRINDQENIIYTLASLGLLAQGADNNYKLAEEYFNEAIKISTQLKNDYMLAYCYSRMKGLYRSQGNAARADEYINKALSIYEKTQNTKEVANTLIDIGYDQSYVYGDNTNALVYIARAQRISESLNDVGVKASILSARASVMREMGELQKSLEYANQSLQLYKELENEWGMAGSYIDLGNIYKQLGEYDLALRNQQYADSLYQKMNSPYSRLAPLANMGEIYTSQGDYRKGLEYYQQSHAIMIRANDLNENLCIIQAAMGESYMYLNDFSESDKWLKESLKNCNTVGAIRPKADVLAVLGRLKIEQKLFEEADKYLTEGARIAKEKSMRISYVYNLGLLGRLEVERKNFTKAKPLLEESVTASREMGKTATLWESLYWLGILYRDNNQLKQSSEYLKESVTVIEKIRNHISGGEEARKMFSSDIHILKVYEALVDVLLKLGDTDLALSYLQKNNDDNIKAKFKGLDIRFESADKNKILEQERTMKAKLDGVEQQIAAEKALPAERQNQEKLKRLEGIKTVAESDYLKFVNQQVNVRPELSKYFNNSVQPAQLKGKKKQIPKDMALLSYLPGENQLYIFIATTDTVVAKVVNVPRAQLTRNITAVLNIIKTKQAQFGALSLQEEERVRKELVYEVKQNDVLLKPFEELFQFLIAPASEVISDKKRLCIIPNGSLSYIPFQLLGKTLTDGSFSLLMNQFAVFYANSTDMLLRAPEEQKATYNILAFGNPDKTLPSTEIEVKEIKSLFPSASVYLRDEATEDKAKYASEDYNVMHFATHGNLDYEDFAKSFLTMAGNPAKDEDGMLTLEELWGMDVMSHLNIVVLSACQTAVSNGSDESSPVSPASGFLQNGVKSVIATLWKVDDEATSLLMTDFYKNIKTMDAVDALRLAQINLANNPKFIHPYYWAAAVLLGDWR